MGWGSAMPINGTSLLTEEFSPIILTKIAQMNCNNPVKDPTFLDTTLAQENYLQNGESID
jgi:hypothetical protein